MALDTLIIKNLRCFEYKRVDFSSKNVCIFGPNGSGKSSLFEAIYMLFYGKSPRTSVLDYTIQSNADALYIEAHGSNETESWVISQGFDRNRNRKVMVDGQAARSFKALLSRGRVMLLSEEDLELVKGGPDKRRDFIDAVCCLEDHSFIDTLKLYKKNLIQKNALLANPYPNRDMVEILTETLHTLSETIRVTRIQVLKQLIQAALNQEKAFCTQSSIGLDKFNVAYKSKLQDNTSIQQELIAKKVLYGAHLDDWSLVHQDHAADARYFLSRGQQKMLVLLLKTAALSRPGSSTSLQRGILLIDDFITDFDHIRGTECMAMILALPVQAIFAQPAHTVHEIPDFIKSGLDTLQPL